MSNPYMLHLVSREFNGSVAKGTYNLHCALLDHGFSTHILADSGYFSKNAQNIYGVYRNKYIYIQSKINTLFARLYPKRLFGISSNNLIGYDITYHENYKRTDSIQPHWINHSFISFKPLSQIHKPIIWAMNNMLATLDAHHYAMSEKLYDRFRHSCGKCSTLAEVKYNISLVDPQLKARFCPKTMQLMTLDGFIRKYIAKSVLLKDFLFIPILCFEFKSFGCQHSNIVLRLFYNAYNVFVALSMLEVFGKTITKFLSCRLLVVSFVHSTPQNIILHKYNSYLAHSFGSKSAVGGIEWILSLGNTSCEVMKMRVASIIKYFRFKVAVISKTKEYTTKFKLDFCCITSFFKHFILRSISIAQNPAQSAMRKMV